MLKRNRYIKLVLLLVMIGVISGILYYQFLPSGIKTEIIENVTLHKVFYPNFIIKDLIIMSIILVLSFFLLGPLLNILVILYEVFSLGFLLNIFNVIYHSKGVIYILLYFCLNRLFSMIIYLVFFKKVLNISKSVLEKIFKKKTSLFLEKIFMNFKICLFLLIIIFIYNIVMYYLSPCILKYLKILLV